MKSFNQFVSVVLASSLGLLATAANAQTIKNAYAFFDQVITNRATQLQRGTATELSGRKVTPTSSNSADCRTAIKSTVIGSGFPHFSVDIDWRRAVEIRHFFKDPSTPGLVLVGGVSTRHYDDNNLDYGDNTGPAQALAILTGSLSMDERLTKAVKLILDGCADKSLGF